MKKITCMEPSPHPRANFKCCKLMLFDDGDDDDDAKETSFTMQSVSIRHSLPSSDNVCESDVPSKHSACKRCDCLSIDMACKCTSARAPPEINTNRCASTKHWAKQNTAAECVCNTNSSFIVISLLLIVVDFVVSRQLRLMLSRRVIRIDVSSPADATTFNCSLTSVVYNNLWCHVCCRGGLCRTTVSATQPLLD